MQVFIVSVARLHPILLLFHQQVAHVQKVIFVRMAPLIQKVVGQEHTTLILAKGNVLPAWSVIIVQRTRQISRNSHVLLDISVQTEQNMDMNFHVQRDTTMTKQWLKVYLIAFLVNLVIIVINQV
jgi:hypothetical protein